MFIAWNKTYSTDRSGPFLCLTKRCDPGKYHELVNLRNSTKIQKHIGLWIFRGPLVHLPMYSWIVFASIFCYCLKVSKCDWFDPSHPARSAEVLQLLKPSQELLHQRKMAMRFVMVYRWPCSILQDGVRIPKFIQTNWSIFTVAFLGDKSVASIGVIQGHFVWITSVSFSRGWGSWKYIQASIFRACFLFNMPQKDLRTTNMAKWEWNNRPPSSHPDTDAELVEQCK